MKKTYLIILFALIAGINANYSFAGEQESDSVYVQKDMFVANFLLPGFTYERGITEMSTLSATVGITGL